MSDTINLNYLIVPRGQTVNALEAVIQNNLGASFNYIPLDIRQIHPGSVDERRMQSQVLISDYFNGDPPADYFHIVVYPPYKKYVYGKETFCIHFMASKALTEE
ncbi:hypothetical protein RhiirA5_432709 [Rhizophagus irregularis]|uniref:Uncharacterized protein n=1 Tax=Rhizophagus irregularis TaxID=588596 RepID=A0A2N0NSY0_9GLOM|nr:hypothetical protein RhiirA5_432709 [Rhizophagus irregularis]